MTLDRLLDPMRRIVDSLMRRVDYHAFYKAQVVTQNSDGTLDLQPRDARFVLPNSIPIRLGVPGFSVRIEAGAEVLFGFGDGDPSDPYVAAWTTAQTVTINLTASQLNINNGTTNASQVNINHGQNGAARSQDAVTIPVAALNGAFDAGTTDAKFVGDAIGHISGGSTTVVVG